MYALGSGLIFFNQCTLTRHLEALVLFLFSVQQNLVSTECFHHGTGFMDHSHWTGNWSHDHELTNQNSSFYHCDGHGRTARGKTLIFPILDESRWPSHIRTALYVVGILNVFVGVSFCVKLFMCAIERITHATTFVRAKHTKPGDPQFREVPLWNPTVSTLTLGAVGTGAPEILLTTVETIGHGFDSGRLGPGTIVGSAAFNLMLTVAFCIISVPSPTTRRIEALPVYITTSAFNVLAYAWLSYVLAARSVAVIEVWEAVITFGLFFVFIMVAYFVDKTFGQRRNCCGNDRGKATFKTGLTGLGSSGLCENGLINQNKAHREPTNQIKPTSELPLDIYAFCDRYLFATSCVAGTKPTGSMSSTENSGFHQSRDVSTSTDSDLILVPISLGTTSSNGPLTQKMETVMSWKQAWVHQFHQAVQIHPKGSVKWQHEIKFFFTVPWRLALSFAPPPQLLGGYPTFLAALFFIGVLETVVADMAVLLGCLHGLHETLIAASVVAIGTNLPDLFACRLAASQESTADAAIGHISGGCCVNVFLGLGVPWLTAAVYHSYHGTKFVVPVEDLWNCVVVCTVLAIASSVVLLARRKMSCFGKAELGGPLCAKLVSAVVLFALWQSYILFTYCQTIGYCKIPLVVFGEEAVLSSTSHN